MSETKGYETMRDLVRALQQSEYLMRTGTLALEDLDKACGTARDLYERLVVLRHKAREAQVREAESASEHIAVAKVPAVPTVALKPEPLKAMAPVAAATDAVATKPKTEETKPEPKAAEAEPPTVKKEAVVVAAAVIQDGATTPAMPQAEATKQATKPAVHASVAKKEEAVPMAESPKAKEPMAAPPEAEEPKPTAKPAAPKVETPVTRETKAPEPVALAPKAPETAPIKLQTQPTEAVQAEETAVAEPTEAGGAKTAAEFLAAFRAQAAPKPSRSFAEQMEHAQIDDLLKAISVSDRFWYTKELFGGDKTAFERSVSQMNAAASLEDASAVLAKTVVPDPKKGVSDDARNAMNELLKRRFA